MRIISQAEHGIDSAISQSAIAVIARLREAGYDAYIVGGAVRDLMLGKHPKDFDVATNATPEQVKAQFRNARTIGRRFQIIHVRMGREIIEITTYRGHHNSNNAKSTTSLQSDKGLLLRDNVYGTLEEDATRRDLTINAMYYDPFEQTVLDQKGGSNDIKARLVRIIGDAATRYREDPVRILRVIRFSAKLQFNIESNTEHEIQPCGSLLSEIPAARLFDECLKLFMTGHAETIFLLLYKHNLLQYLFPEPAHLIAQNPRYKKIVALAMASTDHRIQHNRSVTPAFLLAALLWPAVQTLSETLIHADEEVPTQAMNSAGKQVSADICLHTAIPKRFAIPMREMWGMQPKLERRQTKQIKDILANRRFRAAYDLLLLREESGENLNGAGIFWTEQQQLHPGVVGSAPAPKSPRLHKHPRRRQRT